MKPTGNKRQLQVLRRYAFDLLVDGGKAVASKLLAPLPDGPVPQMVGVP
jgi:hypothetical protein